MGDLGTLEKFAKHGATLVEVQRERERQRANAPVLPSKMAQVMINYHMSRDQGAIDAKLRKAAYDRAHPVQKKKPTTEMERIIAEDPKTSAQVIGHHRVPQLPPPPPPPPPKDELTKMRTVFPRTTNGETGFHYDFAREEKKEARKASDFINQLTPEQVQADPAMAKALATIRSRVLVQAQRSGADGIQQGVYTKYAPKEFQRPGPTTRYD